MTKRHNTETQEVIAKVLAEIRQFRKAKAGTTWYVAEGGSDDNSGKSLDDAFLTGGRALLAALSSFDDAETVYTVGSMPDNPDYTTGVVIDPRGKILE